MSYFKAIFILVICISISCNKNTDKNSKTKYTKNEDLAIAYCGSCHLFPAPNSLSKNTWINKVLPNMATRMGFNWANLYKGKDADEVQELMRLKAIPDHPIISEEKMLRIVKYFEKNALEKPNLINRTIQPDTNFSLFTVENLSKDNISTQTTLIKNFASQGVLVKSFDEIGLYMQPYGQKAKKISGITASAAGYFEKNFYFLNVQKTKAYNLPKGKIIQYNQIEKNEKILIDSLIFPINMDLADLNNDKRPDFVICEKGDFVGRLSLFISGEKYKRILLKNSAGATKAQFIDINNDAKLDIITLFSGAKQEVVLFINKGDGAFQENLIAQFPPTYGLSDFQIADVDQDNLPDITLTNGNIGISNELKNYHGVRIFKNNGKGVFKESWFYPIFGASKIIVDDFDGDKMMDLFVIAHLPNFKNKNYEDLLFFKNIGKGNFKPFRYSIPFDGRPFVMEKADIDNDSDKDILVGNFIDNSTNPGVINYQKWTIAKKEGWLLKNNTNSISKKK